MKKIFGCKAVWTVHDSIDDAVLNSDVHKERLAIYATLDPDVIHYPTQQARVAYEQRGVPSKPGIDIHHAIDEAFLAVCEKMRLAWQTAAE
jgi:hypothetical protein